MTIAVDLVRKAAKQTKDFFQTIGDTCMTKGFLSHASAHLHYNTNIDITKKNNHRRIKKDFQQNITATWVNI